MTNLEKIRQEIERLENMDYPCDTFEQATGFYNALDRISNFIDSLPEEHFRDSTKMVSEDLEKAADNHIRKIVDAAGHPGWDWTSRDIKDAFIAGAEWQKSQMPMPEDTVIFMKGVEEGRRLEKHDIALTREDIRRIVKIADDLLDDPKARVEYHNHNEEYYYNKILEKWRNETDSEN